MAGHLVNECRVTPLYESVLEYAREEEMRGGTPVEASLKSKERIRKDYRFDGLNVQVLESSKLYRLSASLVVKFSHIFNITGHQYAQTIFVLQGWNDEIASTSRDEMEEQAATSFQSELTNARNVQLPIDEGLRSAMEFTTMDFRGRDFVSSVSIKNQLLSVLRAVPAWFYVFVSNLDVGKAPSTVLP